LLGHRPQHLPARSLAAACKTYPAPPTPRDAPPWPRGGRACRWCALELALATPRPKPSPPLHRLCPGRPTRAPLSCACRVVCVRPLGGTGREPQPRGSPLSPLAYSRPPAPAQPGRRPAAPTCPAAARAAAQPLRRSTRPQPAPRPALPAAASPAGARVRPARAPLGSVASAGAGRGPKAAQPICPMNSPDCACARARVWHTTSQRAAPLK
jgi:hypothetical protein